MYSKDGVDFHSTFGLNRYSLIGDQYQFTTLRTVNISNMSGNSQAFTSANRFAALESLNSTPSINGGSAKVNGLPNGKSHSNGSASPSSTSSGKKSKSKPSNGHANAQMNGSADANAGKKPKDRISSSSVESQPSIDVKTTPRDTTKKADTPEASSTTTRQRANKKKEARGKPSLQADALSLSNLPVGKKVRQVVDTANAKIDWEVPRKTLHASIGFLVLYLYNTQPDSVWPLIRILASACVVVYLTDLLRFRSRTVAGWYNYLLGALMRESEKTTVNGVVWYLIGVTWTLAVYPRDLAVIAIMT
ncbi:hypothetical protein QFC22_003710 [Naganishia vaughanmartiniae]|uniref:Uncharacterized protein n=1 Tax=Naganishia vaughanmartiniae TaxID=1424756 RepID=A0ACC2X626_9TREE|nr:hypothetical protein QFC22_003710 [Naganishia vaughanmartiniae]